MSIWRNTRVLVAGGTGFIGSHLVERLVAQGSRVTVTTRSGRTRNLAGVADRVRILRGDLADPGFCKAAVEGQDVVFHLAADVGGVQSLLSRPASLFRNNMLGFLHLIEYARRSQVQRFLITSSACVYPRHCRIPTSEEEGFRGEPEPSSEGYGWAKRMQEYLGRAYAAEFGMRVCIARPYSCYGPRDHFDPASARVIPSLIRRAVAGENPLVVWGDGTATRSFLYVDDLVEGLLLLVEKDPGPMPVNLGSEEETSIAELARQVAGLVNPELEVRFDPSRPAGQPRRVGDATRARELLGFQPRVSLEEGLRRTIEWYRKGRGISSAKGGAPQQEVQ